MRLFRCESGSDGRAVCVHVRSFEMLVCVCVVRCVAVGACIHARMCVARTMRRSLAVVYVLAFLPCVASTDEHLPRIATHVAASSFKLEEHELYRKCEEPIHSSWVCHSKSAHEGLPHASGFARSIAHQFIQSVSSAVFSDAHIQPIPARCAYLCWLRRSVSLRVAARDGGGIDSRQSSASIRVPN